MDQLARVERLKATVAQRREAGLLCGRPKRTDLDTDIAVRLADGQAVSAIAKALGCHPRVVRRVRDRQPAAPTPPPVAAPKPPMARAVVPSLHRTQVEPFFRKGKGRR